MHEIDVRIVSLKSHNGRIMVQSQVMFDNRKERLELLQELVVSDKDFIVPRFSQVRIGLIKTIITDFILFLYKYCYIVFLEFVCLKLE